MKLRLISTWKVGLFPSAAILAAIAGCGKPETKAASPIPKVVRAEVMTIQDAAAPGRYTVPGEVRAMFRATLSSKVMGRVTSVGVREGDPIRKGQNLVSIDSRELQSAVSMAAANHNASLVGVGTARTAAEMEDKTSRARIVQAESQVQQSEAALAAAQAKLDLALAGPRNQELSQSRIAVAQAQSSLNLARVELDRAQKLVEAGALARRELDVAQNRFELAKGQYEAAVEAENMAKEGSRKQDIRAAEEGVSLARATLRQAQAGVTQAKAAAMQVAVRRKEIEMAQAQTRQSAAALSSAKVSLSYGTVAAPFDGRVVSRLVDPGAMANPGVPLLEVEGGAYRFEAIVPEKLLASISTGTTAPVTIDALPGKTFDGRVVEIVPQADGATHSFIVKFSLDHPGVKSGMFGRAALPGGTAKRVLIPASATWVREGLHYVFALNRDGIARLRIVTVGEPTAGQIEVLSGLSSGDRIVVGNRASVSDGVKVEEQ